MKWSWYWRKGGTWDSGDACYYWQNTEVLPSGESLYTYYAGYRVPDRIAFQDKDYYLTKEYPLKNLLPLTDAYQGSYVIKQKEGKTFSWTCLSSACW